MGIPIGCSAYCFDKNTYIETAGSTCVEFLSAELTDEYSRYLVAALMKDSMAELVETVQSIAKFMGGECPEDFDPAIEIEPSQFWKSPFFLR